MSLQPQRDVSLRPFNSFGVEAKAAWFVEVEGEPELRAALAFARDKELAVLVIGGGSNLLFTRDFDGLVIRMANQGRRILEQDETGVLVEAEAGEAWHPFVLWTLEQGLAGLENLSLIPGSVGAAPVQNIGAYGVELKDCFAGLTALDSETGEVREFFPQDCRFAYRDSLFKQHSGRWLILRVRFRLGRKAQLNLEYGPVRARLLADGIENPTASDVSRAICAIRSEKLPDPAQLGNAGSFFKNPVISATKAAELKAAYPDLVAYSQGNDQVKLAAGWLIERAGWKGHRQGDSGVHRLQALVLVNYGSATGAELLALARSIQQDIAKRFGVELEIEPNVL